MIKEPTQTRADPTVSPQPPRRLPRIRLRGLGLRVSERRFMLLFFDLLLLCLALAISIKWRTDWLDSWDAVIAYWKWWGTLVLLGWLIAQLLETDNLARAASAPHSMLAAGSAAAITAFLYQWIPILTPPLASRRLSFIFVVLAVTGVAAWRGLYALLFVQPAFLRRAIVMGAGQAGCALAEALRDVPEAGNPYHGTGYQLIGFVDDDPNKQDNGPLLGLPVLGASDQLTRLVRIHDAEEVVLAITDRQALSQTAFDALLACREQGVRVTTVPDLYEHLFGRVPVDHIGRNIEAVLRGTEGQIHRLYIVVKRVADVLVAVLGLAPLALVALLAGLTNAFTSRGPLFYHQTRVGCRGPFQIYKFRTMRPDAEAESGAVWAKKRDPRITPAGRVLRVTRLDELPQLLNILRGEMSLIGPRPERPEFVDDLAAEIPYYRARYAVRPGITGWAQVRFGYGNSIDHARTKLEYDLYYVRHAGFYLDALIWLKTISMMLRLGGQ